MAISQPFLNVDNAGVDTIENPSQIVSNVFVDGDESNPAVHVITFDPVPNDGFWRIAEAGDYGLSDVPQPDGGWSGVGSAYAGTVTLTKTSNGSGVTPLTPSVTPAGDGLQAIRYWIEGQHQEVRIWTPANSIAGKFTLTIDNVLIGEFPYDVDGPTLQTALGGEYNPWLVSGTAMNEYLLLYRHPTGVGPTVSVANGTPPIETNE